MCKKCVKLSIKYFPDLTEEERGELLWGATAFPFSKPDYLENQLRELVKKTDGTLQACLAYADAQLSIKMKKRGKK